jgi:hypothetical protein
MRIRSRVEKLGIWHDIPQYSGTRVMMMPVLLEDADSLPNRFWRSTFAMLANHAPVRRGVAYITIDEAIVKAGECHRRPGLHVDGLGGWGGPSPWASSGMLLWASVRGAHAWRGELDVEFDDDGGCEGARASLNGLTEVPLQGGCVYQCGPFTIHESVPMRVETLRSFARLSMPSDSPWFEGYTPNPLGVKPTGPILPRRVAQMGYRA